MPHTHIPHSPVGAQKALDSFIYQVFTESQPYTSLSYWVYAGVNVTTYTELTA